MTRLGLLNLGVAPRAAGAALLLLGLVALEIVAGPAFIWFVAIALLIAPAISWRAWWHLRNLRRQRAALGEPVIRSLQSAYYVALFLAIASSAIAVLAALTILRAVPGLIPAIPREVYLIGLAYPMLLLMGPAFEWLILFSPGIEPESEVEQP